MTHEVEKLLGDMLERSRYLLELSGKRSLEEMEADRVLRSAVERELMVLGEALYLLREESPATAERIGHWREIIAMRHKLVHGYSKSAPVVLREIIADDLPSLVTQLEQMLLDSDNK